MMKQIIIDDQVTPYYISDEGKCYNSKTGKYLKGQKSNSGYINYNLSLTPQIKKRFYAHRLVARFFLNNGQKIQSGYEVNHKDCDKLNNLVENLEIITSKENSKHAIDNHCKKLKTVYQYDKNLNIIKSFYNIQEAVRNTGISREKIVINLGAKKPTLTKEGHFWSYKKDLTQKDIAVYKNTGKPKTVLQYDLNNNFIAEYKSCGEAKRKNFPEMKKGSGHISECCRGKLKQYKGYIWKYKDDIV